MLADASSEVPDPIGGLICKSIQKCIKGEAYEKDETIYGICIVGGYDADNDEYAGSDRLGAG